MTSYQPEAAQGSTERPASRIGVARLGPATALHFAAPDPDLDLPGHVRAGSGLRWFGGALIVVQDDVNALARVAWREDCGEPASVTPVVLPAGAGGRRHFSAARGNKADKLDLEACTVLPDGRLLVLPSGSTAARERLVLLSPGGEPVLRDGGPLFAALRAREDFAGSSLNLEGLSACGESLWLFQRGNGGQMAGGIRPVNAVGRMPLAAFLAWLDGDGDVPALDLVRAIDLGRSGAVAYGFTDAAPLPDGRVAFLAGAEDSPDTFRDGAVLGARIGLLGPDGSVRLAEIVGPDGAPTPLKLEGLVFNGDPEAQGRQLPTVPTRERGRETGPVPGWRRAPHPVGPDDRRAPHPVGPDDRRAPHPVGPGAHDSPEGGERLSFLVVADMDDPEVPAVIAPLVWDLGI